MVSLAFLKAREIGYRSQNRDTTWNLNGVLEDIICVKDKQHFLESVDDETWVPPFACQFSSVPGLQHILAVADEDGCMRVFNTNKTGNSALNTNWLAHTNAVFDIAWSHQCNQLLTASGDQTVALWDVSNQTKLAVFKGHMSSVKTVNFLQDSTDVFASGSRDGHIMIWDCRCVKKDGSIPYVNQIRNAHMNSSLSQKYKKRGKLSKPESSQQSVTSVIFQDGHTLVSAGAVDGTVKVWDLRKNYSIVKSEAIACQQFAYTGSSVRKPGFSNLCFDSSKTRLFASCMDDVIYEYNCASFTCQPVNTYRGHRNSTFYVKASVSPNDAFLLSGSSDDLAYVWKLDSSCNSHVVLQGHQGEVTDVAWCPTDITKLVTLSDDNSLMVWNIGHNIDSSNVVGKALPCVDQKVACPGDQCISNRPIISSTVKQTSTSVSKCQSSTFNLPSIKRWLSPKSDHKGNLKSPKKPSPRKIHLGSSASSRSTYVCENASTTPIKKCVKRKLEDCDLVGSSKSKKCHLEYNMENDVETDSIENMGMNKCDKTIHGKQCNTQLDELKQTSNIGESPTRNLPNSVLNPQPRNEPVYGKENTVKKTDWLTMLGKQRQNSKGDSSPSQPLSPVQSPLRKSRTILTYFSPKRQQKKSSS